MPTREDLRAAAQHVCARRAELLEEVGKEQGFLDRGGILYPYDIVGANLEDMIALFESSGFIDQFESGTINSVCDIGCANGDLSFSLSRAGYKTTAIDWSYRHDQATYIVSSIARKEDYPLSVVDITVDRYFSLDDLRASVVHGGDTMPGDRFDLAICFGLLYHLKNPFAFMESLRGMCRYAIVGTHLMTHTPNFAFRADQSPLAYLVDPGELNGDPSNYWILTLSAFKRLANRCGFKVIGERQMPNNPLHLAVPDRVDLGVRAFLMLEAV